jgi:hypothetical protein
MAGPADSNAQFEAAISPLLHDGKPETFSGFTYCRQCDHLIVGFKGKLCSVCVFVSRMLSAGPLACLYVYEIP